MQVVFQAPFSSLSPRLSVTQILEEGASPGDERREAPAADRDRAGRGRARRAELGLGHVGAGADPNRSINNAAGKVFDTARPSAKRTDRLPAPCLSLARGSEDFTPTLPGFPEHVIMRLDRETCRPAETQPYR